MCRCSMENEEQTPEENEEVENMTDNFASSFQIPKFEFGLGEFGFS